MQSFQDFEWLVEVGIPARGFTLPTDYNKMLRRAQGDIIVSLQDYIHIPRNALSRIAELNFDKTAYTFPVAKRTDGPEAIFDWRRTRPDGTIHPNEWEIDLGAAPIELFRDIGGFDERYCEAWGWDNVEVAYRAAAAGYRFHVSNETVGIAYDHDKHMKHPFRGVLPDNALRAQQTEYHAACGSFKLDYL